MSQNVQPTQVQDILSRHILRDGYNLVMDLKKSKGVYLHDALRDRAYLDFFTCFATIPIGYNHPGMLHDEQFREELFEAALINPTNSDLYTTHYAHFMDVFARVGIPSYLPHAFFIAGGSLAVENALKVAMDYKVQRNFAKGHTREVGHKVLHFREAFHGRSGYTLSLTNTDPTKTRYFSKFSDWPRVLNPKIQFPYSDAGHEDLLQREALAVAQIKQAFVDHGDDICAIIIEPIQCEGGDNHFRTEFMEQLRILADENDVLLVYDEVQVGMAATGTFWCHEQFGPNARPDVVAFGKKMQVCGILAGPKVDAVETNVFHVSSRINSTWGGNLVDMVRARRILEIVEQDNLLHNAAQSGKALLEGLVSLSHEFKEVTNARGRGLICAFDLPTRHQRDEFIRLGRDHGALFLGCAERTIRFRPAVTMSLSEVSEGMSIMRKVLKQLFA